MGPQREPRGAVGGVGFSGAKYETCLIDGAARFPPPVALLASNIGTACRVTLPAMTRPKAGHHHPLARGTALVLKGLGNPSTTITLWWGIFE